MTFPCRVSLVTSSFKNGLAYATIWCKGANKRLETCWRSFFSFRLSFSLASISSPWWHWYHFPPKDKNGMPSNGTDMPSLEFENQNILVLRGMVERSSFKESSAVEENVYCDKKFNTLRRVSCLPAWTELFLNIRLFIPSKSVFVNQDKVRCYRS